MSACLRLPPGNRRRRGTVSGFPRCPTALTTWTRCPAPPPSTAADWAATRRGPSHCGEQQGPAQGLCLKTSLFPILHTLRLLSQNPVVDPLSDYKQPAPESAGRGQTDSFSGGLGLVVWSTTECDRRLSHQLKRTALNMQMHQHLRLTCHHSDTGRFPSSVTCRADRLPVWQTFTYPVCSVLF